MTVHIRVAGALRDHVDTNLTLDGVQSVAEALARLALPPDMGVVIMVNGRLATWQTPLEDGDLVQIVPVAAGGRMAPDHAGVCTLPAWCRIATTITLNIGVLNDVCRRNLGQVPSCESDERPSVGGAARR